MKPQPTPRNTDYLKPMSQEQGRQKRRKELLKKMNEKAFSIAGINFEQDLRNLNDILK